MNKVRRKRCKFCNTLFTPRYSTLQRACSPKCAMEIAEQKKKKDKQDLLKAEKERDDFKRIGEELKKTQVVVNEYVRKRDKFKPCISQNTPWQEDFDAGHCFSVKSYPALRFDLDNIHGQSINANRFKEGDEQNYIMNLPNRIGEEKTNSLIKRAKMSKRYDKRWTRYELKEIRAEIKLLSKLIDD